MSARGGGGECGRARDARAECRLLEQGSTGQGAAAGCAERARPSGHGGVRRAPAPAMVARDEIPTSRGAGRAGVGRAGGGASLAWGAGAGSGASPA